MSRVWRVGAAVWSGIILAAYGLQYPIPVLVSDITLPAIVPGPAWVGSLCSIAVAALVIGSLFGWGYRALSIVRGQTRALDGPDALLSIGMGVPVLATLVLAANLIGRSLPLTLHVLVLAGVLAGARPMFAALRALARSDVRTAMDVVPLAALPLGMSIVGALAPATQFDSLVYHLALPARFLAEGRMVPHPDNIFFVFPQNAEMLFQTALALWGETAANVLAWSFYPLTALLIHAFARRFPPVSDPVHARAIAVLAALFWLYAPAILLLATGTYVDVLLAFQLLCALYVAAELRATGAPAFRSALLAGCLAGSACGVKYTALMFLPPLILFLWHASGRITGTRTVLFTCGAGALFAPWLLRNALLAGNPVAPWATALFPSGLVSPAEAARYLSHIASHGPASGGLGDALLLPWRMTVGGSAFGGAFDIPGPLPLMLAPLGIVGAVFLCRERENSTIWRSLAAGVLFVALGWVFSGRVLRFLVPLYPAVMLFSALGAGYLLSGSRVLRSVALGLITFAAGHSLLLAAWVLRPVDPCAPVLGGLTRDVYLSRALEYYPCSQVVRSLHNARVLVYGDTRGYHWGPNAVVPTVFDDHPVWRTANDAPDAATLARLLYGAGFTHVAVDIREAVRLGADGRLNERGRKNWQTLQSILPIAHKDRYCILYAISAP